MTNQERKHARQLLLAEVGRAVRQEVRAELILAGVAPVEGAAFWDDQDKIAIARRLRRIANELDPPEEPTQ